MYNTGTYVGRGAAGGSGGGGLSPIFADVADFTGNDFTDARLVGKNCDPNAGPVNFSVQTNNGAGTLMKVNDFYTFNSVTGTITIESGAENIMITRYN